MKKLKLRKSVKVILTIILLIIAIVMYANVGHHGELAKASKLYEGLVMFEWFYILAGQLFLYAVLWDI